MRALTVLTVLIALAGCDRSAAVLVGGGHPQRGAGLIRHYGCGSCHTIPGIRGAHGKVGPPLQDLRHRAYIAGVISNTPDNLSRWIEHPQAVDPRTAMPELGVKPDDARHIAAYLYSH